MKVISNEVVTYGDESRGIAAEAGVGNVVTPPTGVFTYGYRADGIAAVTDVDGNIWSPPGSCAPPATIPTASGPRAPTATWLSTPA